MVMYEIGLGQEALKIYRQADKCEKEALPEAAWNTKVYAPFLGVVLSHPKFGGRLESMDLYVYPRFSCEAKYLLMLSTIEQPRASNRRASP